MTIVWHIFTSECWGQKITENGMQRLLLVLKGLPSNHTITHLSRTIGFSEESQYMEIYEGPLIFCGQDKIDGSTSTVALHRPWGNHLMSIYLLSTKCNLYS